jgi:hypothetical protein
MNVCQTCGTTARVADNYCRRCGTRVSDQEASGPITSLLQPPNRWQDRTGNFLRQHFKPIVVILVIGGLVGISAFAGDGTDDSAATPAGATSTSTTGDTDTPEPTSTPETEPESSPPRESINGGNGKTYSCAAWVSSKLDDIDQEIEAGRKRTRKLNRTLTQIKQDYPSGTAPAPIADRYNGLLTKYRVRLRQNNRLVDRYNSKLKADCTPA